MSELSNDEWSESESSDDRWIARSELHSQITGIRSAGSFATFGNIENFVHPGIEVDSVGLVRLPLGEADARKLIQQSHQAPFGKGTETLVDESIRKTWEINSEKVIFLNPRWQGCIDQIVERVTNALGVVDGSKHVNAEFYKMLLYEKGAMFRPHKDTEKVSGMFATLVICLPSEHTGGSVDLQHGTTKIKKATYKTEQHSAFSSTFMAWYADVSHEIKPVESGFRWVLVYNLINNARTTNPSASVLDSKTDDFTKALTEWQHYHEDSSSFAYCLDHQYTTEGLRLAQLKGDDCCRVRHVAQSCEEQSDYYVLLANIEMVEKLPDSDTPEEDKESYTVLTHIATLDGENLTAYDTLEFDDSSLLGDVDYTCRNPDVQWGGENLGNQHADIERFYQDSIMVVVPKTAISTFLVGAKPKSPSGFHFLSKLLREHVGGRRKESLSNDILLRICNRYLSASFSNNDAGGFWLGIIAVVAVDLKDALLFSKAIDGASEGFNKVLWGELGELISLHDSVIPDDKVAEAMQKCPKLHTVYENVHQFYEGFCRSNPDRKDPHRIVYLQRWLDSVIYKSLHDITEFSIKDSVTLIEILKRTDDNFRQVVLYQGVKKFIETLLLRKFPCELIVDLLLHSEDSETSRPFVQQLLQLCLEPAILNFDLQDYANYVNCRKAGDIYHEAGPVRALINLASNLDKAKFSAFLERLLKQAPVLSSKHMESFSIPFLGEAMLALDVSSSEVQKFVQTYLVLHVTKFVGPEPEKPTDWARPEEVATSCSPACDDCSKLDKFLRDPKAPTYNLPKAPDWHIKSSHNSFIYLEEKRKNYETVAVTKTLKRWERQHTEWEKRVETTLNALQKLPQAKLKCCCADLYDEIMSLRMLRACSAAVKTGSVIPKKRTRGHFY
ncbi:MAG: hypothetical protein M1814_001160 [Vezdaea aestivalis]|nr:MAG: hypothetical protein M1814_001160 [Vezdaea aestivalis]